MSRLSQAAKSRWARPSVVLSAIGIILFILTLATEGPTSLGRYSTYSAQQYGVKGTFEVLKRLGFPVNRRITSFVDSVRSDAVYVILDPPIRLSDSERNQLIAAVRAGAGLIFSGDRPLRDSFQFATKLTFGTSTVISETRAAGGQLRGEKNGRPSAYIPIEATVSLKDPTAEQAVFLWFQSLLAETRTDSADSEAIILGRSVGKGKVVVISDPAIFHNVFAKDGRAIAALSRALLWMKAAGTQNGGRPVLFDEYHQGYGVHADITKAVYSALIHTPAGRAAGQVIIASLILLFALGARPLPPVVPAEITRRSPLEHVGALANAYDETDAKDIALERLIRGLRRRHPLGIPRGVSHEQYLLRLKAHLPIAADSIATLIGMLPDSTTTDAKSTDPSVRQTEQRTTQQAHIAIAGNAIARIESFTRL